METKLLRQEEVKRTKNNRRDWDRSEWFRRWLELIREKPAAGAVLAH